MPGMEQHVFTEEEKSKFSNDSAYRLRYRNESEARMNSSFIFLKDKNSIVQKEMRKGMTQLMKASLNDSALEERLIPQWAVGCRRLTPGTGFLEALTQPNVDVIFGGVKEIIESGCIDDSGSLHEVDVLICATGFDVSFKPRFLLIGEGWPRPLRHSGVREQRVPEYSCG